MDGQSLVFRPHDLRRIFATNAVNGGLPVHIAAKLLGHLDLNTTQGYVAVYDDQVIRHVQAYVARRRATRPSEEYQEPTRSNGRSSSSISVDGKWRSATASGPMGRTVPTSTLYSLPDAANGPQSTPTAGAH